MPESGLSGSVRGVPSNGHPYRDPRPGADSDDYGQWLAGCGPVLNFEWPDLLKVPRPTLGLPQRPSPSQPQSSRQTGKTH
jgi:hypothetical protein